MTHVMIIGGGLSGSVAAAELAQSGVEVTIVEKAGRIGGKVREYGCKATDKCNNCGVCLTGGLWEKVEKDPCVDIISGAKLTDVAGSPGDFSVVIDAQGSPRYINGIASIIVATGFDEAPMGSSHLQIDGTEGIIGGLELERICKTRGKDVLFAEAPQRVAFIQCVGSRDKKEGAMYCSKVCCSYTTRAAKVIRHYYPDCAITFFYMEMQAVSGGDYFKELTELGVEFIKCRPLKVKGGRPVSIEYEDPAEGRMASRDFDLVFLADGIHPTRDADRIAELCGLGQDEGGFLKSIADGADSGVYLSGCAKGPARIEDVYADAVAVAKRILIS